MSKEATQGENEADLPSIAEESASEPQNENAPLFQAIGTLYGLPERNEEGNFSIEVGGRHYHLFILGDRYRPWLKQYETHPDQPMYLRVYPKYLNILNQEPIISFSVSRLGRQTLGTGVRTISF